MSYLAFIFLLLFVLFLIFFIKTFFFDFIHQHFIYQDFVNFSGHGFERLDQDCLDFCLDSFLQLIFSGFIFLCICQVTSFACLPYLTDPTILLLFYIF
jgi:hypothetical protein